jgi:hypothetical protein
METIIQSNKNKIAVLILVHENEGQVNRLIKHLAKDFDVYVHIDKRSSVKIENNNEHILIYNMYKTYWASFNIVEATLFLLKSAYNKGYDRYLLISGQDLPIVSNKEITQFFENNSYEYIDGTKMPIASLHGNGGFDRMTKYWPNYFHHGKKSWLLKKLFAIELRIFLKIISRIKSRPIDYEFYKGTQWINLTHTCVEKIFEYLDKNKEYTNRFKWTNCADETFFHTIIKQLHDIIIIDDPLRYIDWSDGPDSPKTLREEDYEKIINSNKLFARKFDVNIDKEIIEKIYERIELETA